MAEPSTHPAVRKRAFRRALRRYALITLSVLACIGVLVGFWFLSWMGPRDVDYDSLRTDFEVSEEAAALAEKSRVRESEFEETLAMREPTKEDLALLRQALSLQEEYIEAIPGYDADAEERLEQLRRRYQNQASAGLLRRSREHEERGEALAEEEEFEEAREAYASALEIQKNINENFPLSKASDAGRATRLQRRARYLQAEPLLRRSLRLEEQADEKAAQEAWGEAEALLEKSIALQEQINREYRGTAQANVARQEELSVKLVGIRSGQEFLEIERIADLGDERRAEGENLEAASLYEEAERLQRELNETFPDSPHASTERAAEFERKSQTAESFELGLEIERNHEALNQLLADRRTHEAVERIAALRRDLSQMEETFPRSSLNDAGLQVKIQYLNLVQSDLGFIQDRIYDALLPIPETEGWKMLRTEVPQSLYSVIMGANPSRNQGDVRPVDSVSWVEAKDFCERLTWIMGKKVRLPTENEFRNALGPLRYVVLEKHVWSEADSGGEPREVAGKEPFSSGFHDLLGNVSEWLESVDRLEDEDALHIGGHAQDTLEVIFTVPVRESPRSERNRMVGFRVVMADAPL